MKQRTKGKIMLLSPVLILFIILATLDYIAFLKALGIISVLLLLILYILKGITYLESGK
jgi:hypothetical protein